MLPETLPPEPSPEDLLLQQAVESIRQEKFAQARDILTKLLRTDQNNPDYWVWLSAAMETQKERLYCLQTAFKMDPTHAGARRGLTLLGAMPPGDSVKPFPMQHPRPWEAKVKLADEKPQTTGIKRLLENPVYRLVAVLGAGVILVLGSLVGVGIYLSSRPVAATLEPLGTSRPTVTEYATNSGQAAGPQSTARPLADLLSVAYTATPIYAATPHGDAAGDAYKAAMGAYRKGQWDMVGVMMAQVATAQPGSADAIYFMGESRRLSGNYQDALDLYKTAIEINANYAPSYLGRARANLALNPRKNVLPDLNQAILLDANYAEAYLERGLYYFARQDLKSAQTDLEQAAALRDSPLVEINLARILLAQDENQAALAAATKANQMDVTMLDGYLILGMAYRANGQIDEAVKVLETYLQYKPDNAEAFAVLGAAYYIHGDYETALKNLKQAVRLDKTSSDGYFWLGETYLAQKAYDSALDSFQTSLRLNSASFDAGEGAAKAYMAKGEFNNSYAVISKVEQYAKTDTRRARFLYIRALSLEQLSQADPAYRDWSALLALPPEALTDEMRTMAQKRVLELRSSTPIPPTGTVTKTPPPTAAPATRQPSKTPPATATRAATTTPTMTASPIPAVFLESTSTPTPNK